MTELQGILLAVGVGLAAGNLSYQLLTRKRDWERAAEHTWFQAWALLAVALAAAIHHV